MSSADQLIAVARGELGTTEKPPGSNKTKYGAWFGFNGVAWCSIWVAWCLAQIGMDPRPFIDGYASCQSALAGWTRLGRLRGKMDIQPGDVLFFHFAASHAGANHTGFAISRPYRKLLRWYVRTLEGNTSAGSNTNGGAVQERERPLSIVIGVARPAYSGAGNGPVPAPPPVAEPQYHPLVRTGVFKGQRGPAIFALQLELDALCPLDTKDPNYALNAAEWQAERNATEYSNQTQWRVQQFLMGLLLGGNHDFQGHPNELVSPNLFGAIDFLFWLKTHQQPAPSA